MNRDPKESDFPPKQELPSSDHDKEKAASSSAQWLRLKDPRIVRVSRAFGGKDRHSKVCTIRGLRDRRVRLSVPTAIQLYDLQDRLGLNQPSKVVDWLLNAARHEIDELPPLPIPAGNFSLSPLPSIIGTSNEVTAASQPSINGGFHWEGNNFWKSKSKEVSGEMVSEKKNWTNRSGEEKQESNEVLLNNNFLPRTNHPSLLGLLNTVPLGTNYQWEHSAGDVSHPAGSHGFSNQITDLNSINVVPFPSTLSLSTGNNNNNSQILVYPPGAAQSYFPSHATSMEIFDPRQINQHQMLNSGSQNLFTNSLSSSLYPISQPVKPFSLSVNMMTPKLLHSPNSSERQSHKDHQDFPK